jgi:hypothetical protein
MQVFVSGEDRSIFETTSNLLLHEALIYLISAYYVFDVNYPVSMSGVLYFLQDFILEATDGAKRSIKYSTVVSELKNMHIKKCKTKTENLKPQTHYEM